VCNYQAHHVVKPQPSTSREVFEQNYGDLPHAAQAPVVRDERVGTMSNAGSDLQRIRGSQAIRGT
jgi:hypothetical protein